MSLDSSRLRDDRAVQVVVALVAVGLLARFALLGSRIAHFDEGRVAYWVLHYLETGEFHYRYIIHGPFIQHVDRFVFALLGPTDFATRVPVALVGGLLPLSALWLRHRLSDTEVAALAFFLAFNPIILYYSRFMRSSVLVAAFCFVAFAAFVRWYDGFGVRYFYAGVAMLALGFAAKENAVIYILCWLGAGLLVLDHKLFRAHGDQTGIDWGKAAFVSVRRRIVGPNDDRLTLSLSHLVVGSLLFFALALFFYAPRGGDGVGLYATFTSPGQFPQLLDATIQDVTEGYGYWFNGTNETTFKTYLDRLGKFVDTTIGYAGPLFALAIAGFLAERYVTEKPRMLVLGASYWGFASVIGYPLGTDIWAAWIIVNALVPLAIPAAVGLALIVDAGRDALAVDDRVSVAAVAVLLLLVFGQIAATGATGVYLDPTGHENDMVQYAQPQESMRPVVTEMAEISARNEGTDVLVYGEFVDGQTSAPRTPACVDWFASLPLAWYLNADEMETSCAENKNELPEELPPVVLTKGECKMDTAGNGNPKSVPATRCREQPEAIRAPAALEDQIPARYERRGFLLRTTAKPVVVYVDTEA